MMDINTAKWSEDAIRALGLPLNMQLPTIVPTAGTLGTIQSHSAFHGVELTGIIGDQQSAMVGQRCFVPGMAKTTFGTGAFTLMNTGSKAYESKNGLLTTALYSEPGTINTIKYALEGSVGSCAVGINWFQNKMNLFQKPQEMDSLASDAMNDGGTNGLYFVSSFGGLLAPYWRDDSRGTLVGLTLAHDRTHICLSILEGIAFQVHDVVKSMITDTNNEHELLKMKVDGGVCMSDPLLQSQSNLLNVNVIRPSNVETTALGCAIVSGAGAGLWDTYENAPGGDDGDDHGKGKTFVCQMKDDTRKERLRSWKSAVESSFGWANRP